MRSIGDVNDDGVRKRILIRAVEQLRAFVEEFGLVPSKHFVVSEKNESGEDEEFEVPITIG